MKTAANQMKKKAENESKGTSSSSTEKNKTTSETTGEKYITFVLLLKNVRSLNSCES